MLRDLVRNGNIQIHGLTKLTEYGATEALIVQMALQIFVILIVYTLMQIAVMCLICTQKMD